LRPVTSSAPALDAIASNNSAQFPW
jgi:hypothetical protein